MESSTSAIAPYPERIRAMLALLFLVPLLGCSLFWTYPEKITLTTDYDDTFDEVRSVLASRYQIKTANRKMGKITTEWEILPSDVRTKRMRFISRIKTPEESPNKIRITLLSEVQNVESGLHNYNTENADWDDAERDRKLEQDLLEEIRFRLTSEEMERKILNEVEKGQELDRRLEEAKRDGEDAPDDR